MHFQQTTKKLSSSAERPKSNLGVAERDDNFFEPGTTVIAPAHGTGSCVRTHASHSSSAINNPTNFQ